MFFVIYFIYSLGALIILFFIINNVLPFILGAPFVPSSDTRANNIMTLARIKKGELAADLGSGDGKLVIMMAKKGAIVHGYEVNPFLVLKSQREIKKNHLEKNAFIHWRNFWDEDLSKYDVITVYGITHIMKRLEKKLRNEAKPGARIISNYFKFPNWKPITQEGEVLVYSSSSTVRSK